MRSHRGNESDEELLESDGETIYEMNAIYEINAIELDDISRLYRDAPKYIDATRPNI